MSHAMPLHVVLLGLWFAAIFSVPFLVCWFGPRNRRASIEAHLEIRKKLIDKFSSGQELSAFLESKGAQELLGGVCRRSGGLGPRRALFGMLLILLGLVLADTAYPNQAFIMALGIAVAAFGLLQIIMGMTRKRDGQPDGNCPACGKPIQP